MSENTITAEPAGTEDDLASLLAKREHARPNRLTWTLLVLLIIVAGFAGGVAFNTKFGESTNAATGFAGFTPGDGATFPGGGAFPGGGGTFPGGGSPPGGASAPTAGTIKLVDGSNVYVTDASGNTIKVIVPQSATVTSQTPMNLEDLAPGAQVIIQGETGADGTVTATSVSELGATDAAASQSETDQPTQGETP